MKKHDEFSRHKDYKTHLAEELRGIQTLLREAESFVEFNLAMRDLEKVVKRLENQSGA